MSQLSDFTKDAAISRKVTLPAGAAVSKRDFLYLQDDGRVYPIIDVSQINYMNKAKGGFATASVGRQSTNKVNYCYNAAAYSSILDRMHDVAPNGDLYTVSGNNVIPANSYNASGVGIYKYPADESTAVSYVVEAYTATTMMFGMVTKVLSNGNVAMLYGYDGATGTVPTSLRIAVVSSALASVKAPTAIGGTPQANGEANWDMVALAGGGFMVIYTTSAGLVSMGVYDNSGNVVTALATVHTGTGGAGSIKPVLKRLANNNVAIIIASMYASNGGLYVGVYSPAGAVVTALANKDATALTAKFMQADVNTVGLLCVVWRYASFQFNYCVFSQTAVAAFAVTAFGPSVDIYSGLTQQPFSEVYNDGTDFYILILISVSNTAGRLFKLGSAAASAAIVFTPDTTLIFVNSAGGGSFGAGFFEGRHVLVANTDGATNYFNFQIVSAAFVSLSVSTLNTALLGAGGISGHKGFVVRKGKSGCVWAVGGYGATYTYKAAAQMAIVDRAPYGIAGFTQAAIGSDVDVDVNGYFGPINPITNIPIGGYNFNASIVSPSNINGARGQVVGKTARLQGVGQIDSVYAVNGLYFGVVAAGPLTIPPGVYFEGTISAAAATTLWINGVSAFGLTSTPVVFRANPGDVLTTVGSYDGQLNGFYKQIF